MIRLLLACSVPALLALFLALPAQAAFTDIGDGTVTDTVTGLMWDKCSWGQNDDATCTGTANPYTWVQALGVAVTANAASYKGHNDWRLPNKNELESLVDISRSNPAIDTAVFPNTQAQRYWSSTNYVNASAPIPAWDVGFNLGDPSFAAKTLTRYVRLVRGGWSFGFFDSALTTTVTSSLNPSTVGASVTLTATVDNTSATGTVAFRDGGTDITGCAAQTVTAGVATCATSALTQGGHIITAVYSGDSNYGTSTSANFTQTIIAALSGVCGSANGTATAFIPTANLCTTGTASAVTVGSPWVWSCAGSGGGSTAQCSTPNETIPTNTGTGRAIISGGTWVVDQVNSSGFIPTTGHQKSPPNLPAGYTFPQGLFDITLTGGNSNTAAIVTITYPPGTTFPPGTVYWKYGPTAAPHWYQFPAVIAGNTITLTLTDGALGDEDSAVNGTIVGPGGPGVPGGGAVGGIPTLSEWGMAILSGLLMLGAFVTLRRQRL